jgi:hypothetical protein
MVTNHVRFKRGDIRREGSAMAKIMENTQAISISFIGFFNLLFHTSQV